MQLGQVEAKAKARLQMQLALQSRLHEVERSASGLPATSCPTASFQPPMGQQCMLLQRKLGQVGDAATLRPLIVECPSCPAEWSHINIVKALQLLKQYPPLPEPADWRGLKRRAGVLLDEATAGLRHVISCTREFVEPDIRHPTAPMHEVYFHPRTVGLLVHALSNLGGQMVLFQKASVFVQRWLEKEDGGSALEPLVIANIVLAFGRQGPEAACETALFNRLSQHFEANIDGDLASGSIYNSHFFSNVFQGFAKLADIVRTHTSSTPAWRKRLVAKASRHALHRLESFQPKELSAVVGALVQLRSSTEECRPFLVESLAMLSSHEQIKRFRMQDAVSLADRFCSFTDGTPPDCQLPAEGGVRLTPEVLEGHTELCTAVQRLLRTIAEVAAERIAELRPPQLVSMMRTLAKARISNEPLWTALWTAVLQHGSEQLGRNSWQEAWSPQEVIAVLSGMATHFKRHTLWLHAHSSPQSPSDERLNNSMRSFVRAMGASLPGRLDGLLVQDIAEMMKCLGILADGCPALRRTLHGSRLRLREAATSALTSLGFEQVSLPTLGELVVGLAKVGTDLASVQGLFSRVAAELKTITSESGLHGELLQVAPLFWAMAVHGAGMGRQPPLLKQGLSSTVLVFTTVWATAVLKVVTTQDDSAEVGAPALGEDAFSKQKLDVEPIATLVSTHPGGLANGHPEVEERQSTVGVSSPTRLRASDLAPVLWALATLARTEGGSALQKSTQLGHLAAAFGQSVQACDALLAGCTPSEFGDALWALGRLGVTAGQPLRAAVSAACEADVDFWVAETLRGQAFLGRLLWGAVVLLAADPPEALLTAAKRIAGRLPELQLRKPDPDAFVSLLWALMALDSTDTSTLSTALVDGLGIKSKAGSDRLMATSNPTGTWEWSLLCELLTLAAPKHWPAQWSVTTRNAWDQECHAATKLLGHDVHQILDVVLTSTGVEARINASMPGKQESSAEEETCHALRGIRVDACVLERQCCLELTSMPQASIQAGPSEVSEETIPATMLRYGRERALKWRILRSRGWTVFCIPLDTLHRDTRELQAAIEQQWRKSSHPAVVPICLADATDVWENRTRSSAPNDENVEAGRSNCPRPPSLPAAAAPTAAGPATAAPSTPRRPTSSSTAATGTGETTTQEPWSAGKRGKMEPEPSPCRDAAPHAGGLEDHTKVTHDQPAVAAQETLITPVKAELSPDSGRRPADAIPAHKPDDAHAQPSVQGSGRTLEDLRLSTAIVDAHLSSGGVATASSLPTEQAIASKHAVPLSLPMQTITAFGSLAGRAGAAVASLNGGHDLQLQAHTATTATATPSAHAVAPVRSRATHLTLRDFIMKETKQSSRMAEQRKLAFPNSLGLAVAAPKVKRKAPRADTEGAASRVRLNTRPGTASKAQPQKTQETRGWHRSKCEVNAEHSSRLTAMPDARVSEGKGSRLNKSSQDAGTPPAPRPPPPAHEAACRPEPLVKPAAPGVAVTPPAVASAPAGPAASHRGLVQVELRHAAKKKKLQLRASVSVGELIEQYGKVVKGEGDVILTDSNGLEHGRDITVGMLAEEARAAGGHFPLRLELRLDDW